VTDELEIGLIQQLPDIPFGAGEAVVHAQHFMALFDQAVA
jgi:hypothetical protein